VKVDKCGDERWLVKESIGKKVLERTGRRQRKVHSRRKLVWQNRYDGVVFEWL